MIVDSSKYVQKITGNGKSCLINLRIFFVLY